MASLKYWTGSEWKVVGSEGGGTVGTIKLFAAGPPDDTWVLCDGSIISATEYPTLVNVLGAKTYPITATGSEVGYDAEKPSDYPIYRQVPFKIGDVLFTLAAQRWSTSSDSIEFVLYQKVVGSSTLVEKATTKYVSAINVSDANYSVFNYMGYDETHGHTFSYSSGSHFVILFVKNDMTITHKLFSINGAYTGGFGNESPYRAICSALRDRTVHMFFVTKSVTLRYVSFNLDTIAGLDDTTVQITPENSHIIQVVTATGASDSTYFVGHHIGDYVFFNLRSYEYTPSIAVNLSNMELIQVNAQPSKEGSVKVFVYKDGTYYGTQYISVIGKTMLVKSTDLVSWEKIQLSGTLSMSNILGYSKDIASELYYCYGEPTFTVSSTQHKVIFYSSTPDFKTYEAISEKYRNSSSSNPLLPIYISPYEAYCARVNHVWYSGTTMCSFRSTSYSYFPISGGNVDGTTLPSIAGGVTYIKVK